MLKKILQVPHNLRNDRSNTSATKTSLAGASALVCLFSVLAPVTAQAEFNLNFLPETSRYQDPEWLNFNCNRPRAPGGGFEDCNDNDDFRDNNGRDATAFLMERVSRPGAWPAKLLRMISKSSQKNARAPAGTSRVSTKPRSTS